MSRNDKRTMLKWWLGLTYAEQTMVLQYAGLQRPSPPPLPRPPVPQTTLSIPTNGNVVVFADNADALPCLLDESFDFSYIDPPYNTGNGRLGYFDNRRKGEWLDLIYTRAALALPKLKPGAVLAASFDVRNAHLAYSALAAAFGTENHVASLPRKKGTGANDKKNGMATTHDVLMLFAKDKNRMTMQEPLSSDEFVKNRYTNSVGTKETKGWFDGFLYPKPVALVEKLISVFCPPDGRVLDFFAGSGTTGHAVLKLNRETWARRTFVMILLDEPAAVAACRSRMSKVTRTYGGNVVYLP